MKLITLLKQKSRQLKNEITALSLALKDKRVPFYAKFIIIIAVSYALSPIDLIPDFIPVLGYLDDLILVPLLIVLAIKLIPQAVMEQCRKKVEEGYKVSKKTGWIAGTIIIIIWILSISYIVMKLLL